MEYKENLSDHLQFKNGKKKPKCSGKYPVYGGNGVFGEVDKFNNENVIIIGRVGAYCGSVSYCSGKCWVSDNAISAKCVDEESDIVYFYYLLQNLNLNKLRIGTSQPLLTQTILKDLNIKPLNPIKQSKIASILSSFDKKIEVNNKIIDNLEEQAQAIFKSWFVDFEPFQDDEFIDSELGPIPEGWEVKKLGDLSKKIITGKTPSTKNKDYYGDYLPFIKIPDMHGNVYVVDVETRLSKEGMLSQKNKILPTNTICVSCIATVGLVSLVSTESQTNQQINSVIPKEKVSYCYLYCALTDKYKYLNAIGSSGSTTKNVNKRTFGNLKIIYPGEKPMEKFHNICSPFFDIIKKLQFQNKKLEQIRDSLLPKLMSGEIDVSELNIDTKGR